MVNSLSVERAGVEKAIGALASKNRQALMNLLFENKRLNSNTLMERLGFERFCLQVSEKVSGAPY